MIKKGPFVREPKNVMFPARLVRRVSSSPARRGARWRTSVSCRKRADRGASGTVGLVGLTCGLLSRRVCHHVCPEVSLLERTKAPLPVVHHWGHPCSEQLEQLEAETFTQQLVQLRSPCPDVRALWCYFNVNMMPRLLWTGANQAAALDPRTFSARWRQSGMIQGGLRGRIRFY